MEQMATPKLMPPSFPQPRRALDLSMTIFAVGGILNMDWSLPLASLGEQSEQI